LNEIDDSRIAVGPEERKEVVRREPEIGTCKCFTMGFWKRVKFYDLTNKNQGELYD
jgi:hypothetical protein